MVQIRFAAGSMATDGRSWKPFSLPLKNRRQLVVSDMSVRVAALNIYVLYISTNIQYRLSF